ncbi:uncharacterized protein METZ01_LOCUS272936 [marine metagenome]|uniref:Uncharacterized protein n=1 Tax=marine metagenome TaxID=408172 RepID=A0A382K9I7_9ZZZZ
MHGVSPGPVYPAVGFRYGPPFGLGSLQPKGHRLDIGGPFYWQKVTQLTFLSAYEKVDGTTFFSWLKVRLIFDNTLASILRILSRVTQNSQPSDSSSVNLFTSEPVFAAN